MRIAIQGEKGSNSHMAAMQMFAGKTPAPEIEPCALSADVLRKVVRQEIDGAVLPIENTLHGSVAEHYDLFLAQPVRIIRESSMRIRHAVIALQGVRLEQVQSVLSHPVALSQCRTWLAAHPGITACPFYDTAGSVKHLMAGKLTDVAAIAPALAAEVYGGEVLEQGIEDHAENYTRFHLIVPERGGSIHEADTAQSNKMSIAFAVEHRPGTLVEALEALARAGADLTRIESRPVPGKPWEYIFYVDLRFPHQQTAEAALSELRPKCSFLKELGRYRAASQL